MLPDLVGLNRHLMVKRAKNVKSRHFEEKSSPKGKEKQF